MEVEWRFEPLCEPSGDGSAGRDATLVTIRHDLSLRWPLIGPWVADHLIGPRFIDYIATRTLARIKHLVESECADAAS